MSQMSLHTLVGTALTDRQFCDDLLNGRRHILLAEFDLTKEEREAILGIQAESLQQFAVHLCEWLRVQESPIPYRPRAVAVPYLPLQSPIGAAFCNRTYSI